MKNNQLRFLGLGLTLGLITVMMLGAACTSKPTSAATLTSITIAPGSPSNLPVGVAQTFVASGTYSDGFSGVDISSQVTWASSDTTVATVSATGLASCLAVGTTNITASLDGITSNTVNLTVVAAPTTTATVVTPSTTTTTGTDTGTATTATTTTTTTTTP